MKSKFLRKILAVSLCAALIGGTAAALPVVMPDSGITASAADALSYGDFKYTVSGNEVTITRYSGSSGAVTIPSKIDGKTVTSIGYGAFGRCESLTSITIPNSVTSIGKDAFYRCSSLTSITIPNSVTSIGERAFGYCSSLTSITIPNSVTSIGGSAFSDCSSLTSITIPNSVTSIGYRAFEDCSSLTSITIPNSVTSIGERAFGYCSSLTSITIPNSVTSIGYEAFYGCESLTSITIPNSVTRIGGGAFEYCSSLTSITIPNSVTSIENDAFSDCSSLTSITIPNSVTSIWGAAFSGCSSLTSITIPDSVTSIGQYAFDGTAWYDNQPNGLVYAGKVAYRYKGTMPNNTSIKIKDGTVGMAGGAFTDCSSLTSITIPNSVTSIGDEAFSDCSSLTSITIPNSVTSIGDSAFCRCSSLTSITIPNSVTSIGGYAFCRCSSLTSITIPNSVTRIGNSAFEYCSSLTSITIPNSVTSIGNWAFSGCSSLTSITIPNSFTSIGEGAFSGCSSLTSITIPNSVTSIDAYAFYGCTGLTSITIPNSVTSIGEDAFGYYYDDDYDDYETKKVDDFTIYGKTGSAAEKYAKDNGFKFISTAADTALKNSSSINATSVNAGTAVTLNGKAAGGKAPYTYAYYYKKSTDSTWTKIAGYSTDTSKTFKPTTAGTYTARVNVKDSTGTLVQKDFTVTVKAETTPLKNNSSVGAATVTAGTEVTLNGKAEGGTSPYKYAYYYKKSTDSTWTKAYVTASASAYTKYDSVKFTPTTAGTYIVRINVKDKYGEGTVVSKDFKLTVKDAALTNNSTVSATSVTAGTEVTMTGKAVGGTSPYKYAYYYKKSTDSTWTKAYVTSSGSAYTKYDSMKFTPKTAGTYTVRINVKDKYGEGTVVSKDFKLTVTAASADLTNNSTISATSVTSGTEVTLNGKAEGGTSPYKYSYYYKKSTDSTWTKAYVTSSGSAYTKYDSVKFTPTTAGTYDVRINVRDEYGNGKTVTKDFKLTVK